MTTLAHDHGIAVAQQKTTLYPHVQLAFDKIIFDDTKEFISKFKRHVVEFHPDVSHYAKNILKIFLLGLHKNSVIVEHNGSDYYSEGLSATTVRNIAIECNKCFEHMQTLFNETGFTEERLQLADTAILFTDIEFYFAAQHLKAPVNLLPYFPETENARTFFYTIFDEWKSVKVSLQFFVNQFEVRRDCTKVFVANLTELVKTVKKTPDAKRVAHLVDNLKKECFEIKSTIMYNCFKEFQDYYLTRLLDLESSQNPGDTIEKEFEKQSDRELDLVIRGILNNL